MMLCHYIGQPLGVSRNVNSASRMDNMDGLKRTRMVISPYCDATLLHLSLTKIAQKSTEQNVLVLSRDLSKSLGKACSSEGTMEVSYACLTIFFNVTKRKVINHLLVAVK